MRFTPFSFLGGQSFVVDYLIVGGGARGSDLPTALGGGAGKVVSGSISIVPGDEFNIIVGAGGTGSITNGQTSSIQIKSTITYYSQGGNVSTSGNGFIAGANASCEGKVVAGGGGGASVTGSAGVCIGGTDQRPGDGGAGLVWLDGNFYGGGGGAGNSDTVAPTGTTRGLGGIGGGGNGGGKLISPPYTSLPATSGTDGLGGGGGGQGYAIGGAGNGGSGSVVIRYELPQRAYGGNSVVVSGTYVYHTFTSNGTLTT
jgi:hypothetical protein